MKMFLLLLFFLSNTNRNQIEIYYDIQIVEVSQELESDIGI